MTPRERWLAAVDFAKPDRVPFWPKIDRAYARMQDEPFRSSSAEDLHRWIGSDPHLWVGSGIREVRRDTSSESRKDERRCVTLYRTPVGTLRRVDEFNEDSQAWHPIEFPVRTLEDLKALTRFFEDCRHEIDPEAVRNARERVAAIGESGVTASGIGTSPLMDWVQHLAGIENAHFLLIDHPAEVTALFAEMRRGLLECATLAAEQCPADLVYLTENTSTTLISVEQYRRYGLDDVRDCARVLREAGRRVILHMCGHLKALLPDLAGIPASGFEAFTSPTLGNTTLLDGRSACPDKCLIGGTNAMLWLQPAAAIIERIRHDLDALPHHRGVVITSAGVMPPRCPPETIREVCRFVHDYAARF